MNTNIILTIITSISIAVLAVTICNIFIKSMTVIALTIANQETTVNYKYDCIVVLLCTLIICIYFLM